MKIEEIVAEVEKLSVLELADLVKAIEEKFGVSAAAAAVVAAPAAGGAAAAEEKSSFNVVLKEIGDNKMAVIKAVKEATARIMSILPFLRPAMRIASVMTTSEMS